MNGSRSVVGRFAPSPTGFLHPGHASSFALAWLSARSQNGSIFLRLENIDDSRCRPETSTEIKRDLAWLGMDWDGQPLTQTDRLEAHLFALETLKKRGTVYPCTCSRADIVRAASAPQVGERDSGIARRYPGTCAQRSETEDRDLIAQGIPFCWRMRTPKNGWPDFVDGLLGKLPGSLADNEGDFVVWRANKGNQRGGPSYQLAVVVDDVFQGVTEVVRGDDLLDSTPRQLAIIQELGHSAPKYFHVPLVLDAEGRRLAKRAGSLSLAQLRAQGIGPWMILGQLAVQWGLNPTACEQTLERLRAIFCWNQLKPGPWEWR